VLIAINSICPSVEDQIPANLIPLRHNHDHTTFRMPRPSHVDAEETYLPILMTCRLIDCMSHHFIHLQSIIEKTFINSTSCHYFIFLSFPQSNGRLYPYLQSPKIASPPLYKYDNWSLFLVGTCFVVCALASSPPCIIFLFVKCDVKYGYILVSNFDVRVRGQ
jgi:hypothetical protein